ncbi:MAG: hypothetical protein BMS9Abin34_345 [Patescibacteria group bacterium]|nr:MAG: hypothetical protein BMS9Abin34_345 [Patescibacteria group bacterium]
MSQQHDGGFINSFTLGLVIGGVLGVLFAPKKGEETRETLGELLEVLSQQADILGGDVQEKVEKVKSEARPIIEQVKEKAAPIVEEIKPIQTDQPIIEEMEEEAEKTITEVVEPAMDKAKEDLNQTIEQARAEIRDRIQKRRPRYFKGI